MSQTAKTKTLLDQLLYAAATFGPIVPLFGIDPIARCCLCPNGTGCKQAGKHPYYKLAQNGFKDASSDPKTIANWARANKGGNWGVRTGQPLPDGGFLVVVDVDEHDPEQSGRDTLASLEAKHGKLQLTPRAITGGGGDHYFLRSPIQIGSRTLGPSLDLKGENGYVAIAPSLHRSGGQYSWDVGAHPEDTPIADAPSWVVEGASRAQPRPEWNKSSAKDTLLGAAFEAANMLGDELEDGKYAVCCPQITLHTDGRGNGKDSSTVILPALDGTAFGSFVCHHSHCNGMKWIDVLAALPAPAVAAAKLKYPLKPRLATTSPPPTGTAPTPALPAAAPLTVAQVLTLFRYKVTATGQSTIVPDQVNAQIMLQYDDDWKGVLQFDEFSQQVKFTRPPPWYPDDKPAVHIDVWTDKDLMRVLAFAARKYNMALTEQAAYAAVQLVAERNAIHPVREYLNALKWDGVSRVANWCSKYLGAEDSIYTSKVGQWWLISCVARVMKPGCKADHVLILEGAQGIRKSTSLATLAVNPEWFCDTPFEIGNKDAYIAIRGKWIVELAELDSFNRSETSRAKAFFSSPIDTYRTPYGRDAIRVPRQCAFAGSVNHDQYFKDETGNRRYWPVRCSKIDLIALQRDRDQLWAEVVHLYNTGNVWWPTSQSENEICAAQQDDRAETDVWVNTIRDWLETQQANGIITARNSDSHGPGFVRIDDILTHALRLDPSRQDKWTQIRAGKCMKELGFERRRVMRSGDRLYAYFKKDQ